MTRASRARRVVTTALYGGGGLGALSAAAYGVIYGESKLARRRIKEPTEAPPNAAGLWDADGSITTGLPRHSRDMRPLCLAMIGDSSAAGLGVHDPAETPGAVMATHLSRMTGRPVQLVSAAFIGARSADLQAQVDRVLSEAPDGQIDAAVVMIGANDVTHRVKPTDSIRYLSSAVTQLRDAEVPVVVGTCPDLGTIKPIAQPLRLIARRMSRSLAAAQTIAVIEAGGRTVSLGDLLGPHFAVRHDWFSEDRFHPSAVGYQAAADAILPSVIACLNLPTDTAPASRFAIRRARPIATAAARAATHPGTEVAAAQVDGEAFGHRGRWARLLRRGADPRDVLQASDEKTAAPPETISGGAAVEADAASS